MSAPSSSAYTLLAVTLLLASTSSASRPISSSSAATNTEFIRTSCTATSYPKLCYTSLSTHATKIQTSPKLLASAALRVALSSAKTASAEVEELSRGHLHGPREVGAVQDCVEELGDAVDQIHESVNRMEGKEKGSGKSKGADFEKMINDVETWVSAALTDQGTCSDGFGEMDGKLRTIVKGKVVRVAKLTSNALDLINNYASLHRDELD
ncbi:21 kDa protein [Linum grandiflorum]